MKSIEFTKMQASGNDFVVIESHQSSVISRQLITKICDRKYGIGADGVLLLEKSTKADARMRIFNADGSEAEMCGNGARCAALYIRGQRTEDRRQNKIEKLKLETKAGIIEAEVKGRDIKIKLTDPVDLKLDISVKAQGKSYEVDYINTGVPHAVIEVDDIEEVPIRELAPHIRHHETFRPDGANVDFVEIKDKDFILVRTYERGVEDETLACGTGSVAGAIIASLNHPVARTGRDPLINEVRVKTRSGEFLKVYFRLLKKKITDVWLEGKARIVYRGEYLI